LPRNGLPQRSRVRAQQAAVELREARAVEEQAVEQGVALPNLPRRQAEARRIFD